MQNKVRHAWVDADRLATLRRATCYQHDLMLALPLFQQAFAPTLQAVLLHKKAVARQARGHLRGLPRWGWWWRKCGHAGVDYALRSFPFAFPLPLLAAVLPASCFALKLCASLLLTSVAESFLKPHLPWSLFLPFFFFLFLFFFFFCFFALL